MDISKHLHSLLTLIILILTLSGCRHTPDIRLTEIAGMVTDHPDSALRMLTRINPDSLHTPDRHYHHLLTIKASDKAYILHTSDTLINSVIQYYADHGPDSLYCEALYYGGRVHSDLGDIPTAIDYYQQTLQHLPSHMENTQFHSNVLGQYATSLSAMSLHKKSQTYYEAAAKIDSLLQDTTRLYFDYVVLNVAYIKAQEYSKAQRCIDRIKRLQPGLNTYDRHMSSIQHAILLHKLGRYKEALSLVRPLPSIADSVDLNYVLYNTARIYLASHIPDTAYLYAHRLIHAPRPEHKHIGYSILLHPQLRHLLPPDSVDQYLSDYQYLLQGYYDDHEAQLVITQEAQYNYQHHVKQKLIAESRNADLWRILFSLSALILIISIIIFIQKNKINTQRIHLYEALDRIQYLLQASSSMPELHIKKSADSSGDNTDADAAKSQECAQDSGFNFNINLRQYLLNAASIGTLESASLETISQTDTYLKLKQLLTEDKFLQRNDPLWSELDNMLLTHAPNFKSRIYSLCDKDAPSHFYHTAMLIKCGFSTTEMAKILGRSKSAIVSRRKTLGEKIFHQEINPKILNSIIRSL